MTKNPQCTLLLRPPSIAVHDDRNVSGQFSWIYIFLIRGHKGAKVVKDTICWLPASWQSNSLGKLFVTAQDNAKFGKLRNLVRNRLRSVPVFARRDGELAHYALSESFSEAGTNRQQCWMCGQSRMKSENV